MEVKVTSNEKIGEAIYRMKLGCGRAIKALPGQFVNILVSDSYTPLLRRPFSIYYCDGKNIEIVYKVLGDGTKLLSEKKQGDVLDVLGPLGGSYLDFQSKIQNLKSKIVIIGGGTGAASTYFLAKYLKSKKIKYCFIQGARTKEQIVAPDEFRKLGCVFTTDDGSMGTKGFVTDVLSEILDKSRVPGTGSRGKTHSLPLTPNPSPQDKKFTVFACGPKPMFTAIQALAEKKSNVTVYASFEEYMGCGIGACLSCVVEIKQGDYTEYKRVCKDGPVFNLKDVIM